MRPVIALPIENEEEIKSRVQQACARHPAGLFLDSAHHRDAHTRFHWLAGWGAVRQVSASHNSLEQFRHFHRQHPDWLLGHLSFELKHELENLRTRHADAFAWPHLHFFVPEHVVYRNARGLWLESLSARSAEELWQHLPSRSQKAAKNPEVTLTPQLSREDYLRQAYSLMRELEYGNIYEVNYCLELAATTLVLQPLAVYQALQNKAQAPFSAFYRLGQHYLMCASPERYLRKDGSRLLSQPMKGTAPRSSDPATDEKLRQGLQQSEKEKSENVMITDLVRNDLSRTARPGSVQVEELFGVRSYEGVHQMISSVVSELEPPFDLSDVWRCSFPMGSMTGAPKISALECIDAHENFARSLYAGSVGYITPGGDADFNVVIRSLLYRADTGYLSGRVGSALTVYCDPEKEYDECLLKAGHLAAALQPSNDTIPG